MYVHLEIYAGTIRDKGREYANSDLYWFGPILDLRPVPKLHLRFSIHYHSITITHSVLRMILSLGLTPPYKL